ncbi:MAG: sugar phosphate isomerase/epimerase [Planctomycetales bacterium]|nr:sugar phosphate isomerase/epimerase [Planctomycetales bacterium]
MSFRLTRRRLITSTVAGGSAATLLAPGSAHTAEPRKPRFRYCLNTGTIRGQELSLDQQIEVAAQAGYDGIEPWIRDIEAYVANGGKLEEIKKRLKDYGLRVESAIGFAQWIVDDPATRQAGLEEAKRNMELVQRLGGSHIAAPPAGATKDVQLDLFAAAERYRALLVAGAEIGVVPQVEVWGHSANLSRLGEAVFVAIESGHPDACLLPDVYHIYKGGSAFAGLEMIDGKSMHCFHMNDYPAEPPRESINDADRVYPGDGVAPLDQILKTLAEVGFAGALSLELFNREYWKQDAGEVARTGLKKMKDAVARALG